MPTLTNKLGEQILNEILKRRLLLTGAQAQRAHQRLQGVVVVEVAADQLAARRGELTGTAGAPGEGAHRVPAVAQGQGEIAADESGGPGEGDAGPGFRPRFAVQAVATRTRSSSATAFRRSSSWAAMKSRRALARDSLPEEVRGSECGGTSST